MHKPNEVKNLPCEARGRGKMAGFSLIETMIVVTLIMIASGIFFMSVQPALKDTRVTNAYNTTLMTLRRAREAAIAERRTYVITFNNAAIPNTITMTQAATGNVVSVQTLPTDIAFQTDRGHTHHSGHYSGSFRDRRHRD